MKKIIVLLLFAFLGTSSLVAQDSTETLFGSDLRIGGFGGPIFEWGTLAGDFGPFAGGGGAVILNDFFIGGYGMGTAFVELEQFPEDDHLVFGHGGFWLGYAYPSHRLAHLFVDAKIGWGAYQLEDYHGLSFNESDRVFVLQPGLGVEINMFQWFRVALTGSYRYVEGVSPRFYNLTDDDFRDFSFCLTLRFGGFADSK